MRIVLILWLMINLVIIICQQARISELEEALLQARMDAIKEINNLRKED